MMNNNKLLAKYLKITIDEFTHKGISYLVPSKFTEGILYWEPDTDWNQLMMVVKKIEEETRYDVVIDGNHCSIVGYSFKGKTKIEAVYNACIEYIKYK